MNACNKWREELLEAAVGGEFAPAAQAHVNECTGCSAVLDAMRARSAMLDAGVASLVRGAEPRAGFEPRVLAAVDAQARPSAQLSGLTWVRLAAVTAACVTVAIFLARAPQSVAPKPPSLSEWQSPTAGLLRSTGDDILRPKLRLGEFYFSPVQPEKKSKPESKSTRSKLI